MRQFIMITAMLYGFSMVNAQQNVQNTRATQLFDSLTRANTLETKLSIYDAEETKQIIKDQPLLGAFMEQNIGKEYINRGDRPNSVLWLKKTKGAVYAYDALWGVFYKKYSADKAYKFIDEVLFSSMDSIYAVLKDSTNLDGKLLSLYNPRLRYYVQNKLSQQDTISAFKHLDLVYNKFKRYQDIKNYDHYINLLNQLGRSTDAILILADLYTSGRIVPDELMALKNKLLLQIPNGKQLYDDQIEQIEAKQRKNFQELISHSKELYGKNIPEVIGKNRYILLSFWGTWCMPCIESHPKLVHLYDQYRNDGLEILSVASESGQDTVKMVNKLKKSIEDQKLPWLQTMLVGHDKGSHPFWRYQVEGYPTKILVRQDGVIVGKFTGGVESDALSSKLKELFGR